MKKQARSTQAETVLAESESRFRAMSDASPLGIFVTDEAGDCTYTNSAHQRISGLTPDAALGKGWSEAIHPEDRERIYTEWYAAARAKKSFESVHRFLHSDGKIVWVNVKASAIHGGNGEVTGYVGAVEDITERRSIEEALRNRDRELTDFLENATVGLHWVAGDGTIIWANRAELEMLGYAREEYFGHHIAEFHADEDAIQDILSRLSRGEELHNYDARLRCKDGSLRHVMINSNVLWEDGRFVHTRCFTRDVTDRKREEEARAHLAAIVESSDDAIIGKDLDGIIRSWNKGAQRIYGYTPAEVIGRSISILIPTEMPDELPRIMQRLRRGEVIDHYETVRVAKDGRRLNVSLTISPIRDEAGTITGASTIARNITELKRVQTERERVASAVRFQAQLLDTVEQGVIATDASGTITYWNNFAEKLYGWTAAEVLGQSILEVMPTGATREQAAEIMSRVAAGESWAGEFAVQRKDGTTFPAMVTDTPIFDEAGKVVGVVGVSVDITARKRAEAVRREQSEVIEQAYDAIFLRDSTNAITLWNRGAERTYGYSTSEARGRSPHELLKTETAVPLDDIYAQLRRDGYWEGELRHTRKDGERIVVESRWATVRDESGEVTSILEIVRDITERKRAEDALMERTRLAALGAAVGAALTQSESVPEMLRRCAETLVQHLDGAFARIWVLNREENVLELQASAGMYTHLDGAHSRVPVGKFKIGMIAAERQPHLTNDVQRDAHVSDQSWAAREGMVAFAGYPLIVEDQLIGVMAMFARHALTGATLEAMASVANGIALGVERKRAEGELREQAEIIETVNRTGQLIAGELDLHKLVQAVTDAATEISDAHFGSFFYNVLNEQGEAYMLYTLSGVPREAFAHFPMPRNTDIFAPTFKGEGTVLIPDVKLDPRYGKNSPYYGMPEGHLPVTSYLAVPVVSRSGEVYGGLFFGHPAANVFTERAARIIEGLAAQAAVAMDNARLFDAVQRERVKAEESEEHYRFLAESIPQIVWTVNPDGTTDYFNQQWYDYTGLSRDAKDVGFAQGVVHPDDLKTTLDAWRRAFETGEQYEIELRLRRGLDGSYRWHLARSLPLRDAEGKIVKWFGTSTDIDDRKRTEESQEFLAKASEVLVSSLDYEATLKGIADLVVPRLADWCAIDMMSDERTIRRLAVTHQDPEKIKFAKELESRYPPSMNEQQGVPNVIRTGKPELYPSIPDALLALVARDAEQLSIMRELGLRSAMIVPLMVQGRALGAITFVSAESGRHYTESDLAFAEDLAHRAALAIENARLYREAQEVNRLKDEFLATLSHELRTPLTAVLGWTRLLGTGQLDETTRQRALETIERNAQAQVQLIDDILDVSRIIRGKLRLNVRPVELAPVIEAAVDSVRPAAEAKGIRLQVVLDRAAGPVSGDPDRLQQVFWNLVSNAIKFTPKDGRVQVTLSRLNSHLEVAVMDTGQGIATEFLPYVFDRFRQADPTPTRAHGGLGLGLAIVRHLVELHGGSVKAESNGAGEGAVFRVTLPLLAAVRALHTSTVSAAESSSQASADGNGFFHGFMCPPELDGLRVLLVEDDTDSRELLVAVLEQCRAEVVAVASVAAAMRALEDWLPDVLISDIEMPGEDGFTLIRRLRQLPAERGGEIPAAALTAYARPEDRMRALVAGFQIHVPKPVEPAELVTVVASLAGRAVKTEK
jgi:PAS domain S-box-containing protein